MKNSCCKRRSAFNSHEHGSTTNAPTGMCCVFSRDGGSSRTRAPMLVLRILNRREFLMLRRHLAGFPSGILTFSRPPFGISNRLAGNLKDEETCSVREFSSGNLWPGRAVGPPRDTGRVVMTIRCSVWRSCFTRFRTGVLRFVSAGMSVRPPPSFVAWGRKQKGSLLPAACSNDGAHLKICEHHQYRLPCLFTQMINDTNSIQTGG